MKLQVDRVYPILKDIGDQREQHIKSEYVFLYDDGQVYRAFLCDRIEGGKQIVSALDQDGAIIVSIPSATSWRLVHKDRLDFVTGREMEESELRNIKVKKDLQEALVKELGLDKKDDDEPSVLNQVPVRTGKYL